MNFKNFLVALGVIYVVYGFCAYLYYFFIRKKGKNIKRRFHNSAKQGDKKEIIGMMTIEAVIFCPLCGFFTYKILKYFHRERNISLQPHEKK